MATFAIISQCNSGGTITPLGTTNVTPGDQQNYAIIAWSGYQIDAVYVDNVSQGALTFYPFIDVETTHTITAVFSLSGGLYCNQADLVSMIGLKRLAEITNDTPNAAAPDPIVVAAMIQIGYDYINTELSGTYTVPLSPTPGIVKDLNVKIAIYNCFLRKFSQMTMPKEWSDIYKVAIADVMRISDLDLALDDTLYPIISKVAKIVANDPLIDFTDGGNSQNY